MMDVIIEAALKFKCEYCGAPADQWCVTRPHRTRSMSPRRRFQEDVTGWADYLHGPRTKPLYKIWRAGWSEAKSDTAGFVRRWVNEGGSLEEIHDRLQRQA